MLFFHKNRTQPVGKSDVETYRSSVLFIHSDREIFSDEMQSCSEHKRKKNGDLPASISLNQ